MRLFFSVVVGGCLFRGWFCVFVCVVVLGPFLVFKLSHSLLFTQKLWRFSGLSERALDLLLGLCLGVPCISRLFNLDCRYPRDQLQPARKKKQSFGCALYVRNCCMLPHGSIFCLMLSSRDLVKIVSHVKSKPGDTMNQEDQHTTMTNWLDADCPVTVWPCPLVTNRVA